MLLKFNSAHEIKVRSDLYSIYFLSPESEDFHYAIPYNHKVSMENIYYDFIYKQSIAFCML